MVWISLPRTLEDDALEVLGAAIENDPRTILRFAFDHEKEAVGLTEEVYVAIWNDLIAPRIGQYRPHGQVTSYVQIGGHQGVADQAMLDAGGRRNQIPVVVWATEKGGRLSVMGFLMTAWHFEYFLKHAVPISGENGLRAWLAGLQQDRARLEHLGIRGMVVGRPEEGFRTWDEWQRHWTRLLEDMSARSGANGTFPSEQR